jgi:hypothetical protein
VRGARRGTFASADVDDVRARLNSLCDSACEIELRARGDRAIGTISKDGHNQTVAARCDPLDGSIVLPQDHTGDVGTVLRSGSLVRKTRYEGLELGQAHASQTWMRAMVVLLTKGMFDSSIDESRAGEKVA